MFNSKDFDKITSMCYKPTDKVEQLYDKYRQDLTMAMYMAAHGHIPSKIWRHNPLKKDTDGNTVAILLAKNGIIPPKEWYYREFKDPFITILLHEKGIELPKKNIWYKDVTKGYDENGNIVTLIEIKWIFKR